MNVIPCLSTPFYEFTCDPQLVDEVINEVKSGNYHSIDGNNNTSEILNGPFYNKKLINWFEECLEQIRKIYFDDGLKLEITNCWATKNTFLSKHHIHEHNQSVVGGVFYLDDCDSGETIFYAKNPWHKYYHEHFMNVCSEDIYDKNHLVTKIKQEKGKLILYPPHILHGSTANKEKKARYVIAFDTFFSGRILKNSNWPYFEIKTTNIHESFQKLKDNHK
jgi:hypothetical protein